MLNTTEKRESIMNTERYAIAVDLDGTLAEYDGWKGLEAIGYPIQSMVDKVRQAVAEGKEVWIFTARLSDHSEAPMAEVAIRKWCGHYDIPIANITCIKYKFFKEFWDDRAKTVVANTGMFIDEYAQGMLTEETIKPVESSLDVQVGGSHYTGLVIQPAEYCYYNRLPSLESSVIRYVTRHEEKNGVQDIDKAIDLLNKLKEMRYSNVGINSLLNRVKGIETK
ncbi:hypothetical protein S1R3Y_000032 [Vibrio phage vB_ValP_VA-RY-3]|nr:hypothetical protein S1R3Y_000032 [Vibrio phage vB_ValP_VA-RY-3]